MIPVTHAATFSVTCDGWSEALAAECSIRLDGPIERGDAERLAMLLRKQPRPGWRYGDLLLNSPGGSVFTALDLSKLVRKSMLKTTTFRIGQNPRKPTDTAFTKCVSACFLIWAAGAEKATLAGAIGLHRPYLERDEYSKSPDIVAELQQKAVALVSEHLRSEQVPTHLVEKMLSNASTQVYWIQEEDISAMGSMRSAWFEEMLIARCKYDPEYDNRIFQQALLTAQEHFRKRSPGQPNLGPEHEKYVDWRRGQYACEFAIREEAQRALRK